MPPKKRSYDDFLNQENNPPEIPAVEFTTVHMENILNRRAQENLAEHPLNALLHENKATFEKLMQNGFELSRIMNILYGAGMNYQTAVHALVQSADEMIALKNNGIGVSTLCAALKAANSGIPTVLKQLVEEKGTLFELHKLNFEDQHISSLLMGSNTKVGECLQHIRTNISVFQELIRIGFLPKNLSGIFHNSGKNLPAAIIHIRMNMAVINRYLNLRFSPESISSMLYNKSNHFAEVFKTLNDNYSNFESRILAQPNTHKRISHLLSKKNIQEFSQTVNHLATPDPETQEAATILLTLKS